MSARRAAKSYDRAYFDTWYRNSPHRIGSRVELARKVAMVVHLTEYYLARPLRTVLDVGCGEAPWRAALQALRPKVAYRGLDTSEYVVRRYGRSRNIGLASFGQLAELRFEHRFDLIVCSDVLHYVPAMEIRHGLTGFSDLLEGLAFLEVYTSSDRVEGDREGFIVRPPAWYRRTFAQAGLMSCGSYGWHSPRLARAAAALEVSPTSA